MRSAGAIVKDYVSISKPRIILLLLVVAWAAMTVASGGVPDGMTFLWVSVAGITSTAASGAFNHVIERDKDRKMGRTADRPVASGRIHPVAASTYATVLTIAAFLALWLPGLRFAAWLTLGAVAFYIVIYTLALKPTTPQNIVIGGFAGSFPALIGWSAVTGGLASPIPWLLAAIVFLWTPPHFWALALLYKEDYAAADYPMMPAVKGDDSTKRQMVVYAALAVGCSLLLVVFGAGGYLFLALALLLGYRFVMDASRLIGHDDRAQFRRYFLWTIQYLGFLLLALIGDAVLVSYIPAAAPGFSL